MADTVLQGMPSTIPSERQSNVPGGYAMHAAYAASTLPPHTRATRVLLRQNDADVEMQAPIRGDGSNDGIGYIDNAVPSSPAPSIDRLSACSSSGRGQRKVMALHASHAGMREGIGHYGHYSQPALLGPAAHILAASVTRDHLVSLLWMWIGTLYAAEGDAHIDGRESEVWPAGGTPESITWVGWARYIPCCGTTAHCTYGTRTSGQAAKATADSATSNEVGIATYYTRAPHVAAPGAAIATADFSRRIGTKVGVFG